MEQHLGRALLPDEHIDHINDDKTDNRVENFQILTRAENARKQMRLKPRRMYQFTCPQCGVDAEKYYNHAIRLDKPGRKGPYCSRACAGKATYVNPWI